MVIKVIVRDVHRVRVFINRHALTIRALIVEKVKTREVSVLKALAQVCRAALLRPENMVSPVAAIVLVPVIIREKREVSSPVSRVIAPVHNTASKKVAIVPVRSMASRVRESKAAISPVAAISSVVVTSSVRVAISLVVVISHVLSMVSPVRENRVAISPAAVISPVAAISSVRSMASPARVAISPASRAAMVLSAVALRSSVAAMIPMRSIR